MELNPSTGSWLVQILEHLRGARYDKDDPWQFLAFAAQFAADAHGQLFQDLWALWESGGKMGGYFVEFGGADGVHLSNTLFLEQQMGWTGVVCEPHPLFREDLIRNRSCQVFTDCVWSRSGETIKFLASHNRVLARVQEIVPDDTHEAAGYRVGTEVDVLTVSLKDLLDRAGAPGIVDYLSIDTEGSEFMILEAYDFGSRTIRTISVEHNLTPLREDLHELLTRNGYRRKWTELSAFDDWYVLESS